MKYDIKKNKRSSLLVIRPESIIDGYRLGCITEKMELSHSIKLKNHELDSMEIDLDKVVMALATRQS